MTDNGDGTHTYSYQMQNDGILTISVILSNQGYIQTDYYSNEVFSGPPDQFYVSIIDFDFDTNPVFGRDLDHLSVSFTAYFLPPVTGTYTFDMIMDSTADLIVDQVSLFTLLQLHIC